MIEQIGFVNPTINVTFSWLFISAFSTKKSSLSRFESGFLENLPLLDDDEKLVEMLSVVFGIRCVGYDGNWGDGILLKPATSESEMSSVSDCFTQNKLI